MKTLAYESKCLLGRSLVLSALLVSSCKSAPTPSAETDLTAPEAQFTAEPSEIMSASQLTPTPNATYGVTVGVIDSCSDGIKTTLRLQTELDLNYWGLKSTDFGPLGDVYFETSTVFFENGQLFSSTSSGERVGPFFNPLLPVARADQTFIYPEVPSAYSQFMLNAEVTLTNLPSNYRPPTTITFTAPGMIVIPTQFNLPVSVSACR